MSLTTIGLEHSQGSTQADLPSLGTDSSVSSAKNSADHSRDAEPEQTLIIEPHKGWIPVNFKELWRFRELLYFLVWRDVKVRYKQTVLGVAWAVLVPVFSVTVFTVIFGNFAGLKNKLPDELITAYPVYVYAGLLPWLMFSNAISTGGMSLVSQQHLLTKIYFPRLFVPSATVIGGLFDMGISFLVFAGLMAIYKIIPGPSLILFPLAVLLATLNSLGIAYLLSALTVSYRDFRFVIPFMVQAWQYVSPVVYPTTIVPERFQLLYALNPIAGTIELFRSAVFGLPVPIAVVTISAISSIALFVLGSLYFRKTERKFADIA